MFEGKSEIKFSMDSAKSIVSLHLSKFFEVPIKVTKIDTSYSSIDVTFEEVLKPGTKEENHATETS